MEKFTVFSDIEGYKTEHGGTFPSYLTVTTDRPDMVSIDKTQKKVLICELTVPFESNITARHTYTYTPVGKHYLKKHSVRIFQQLVYIFNCRKEPTWNELAPLCPPLH